MQHLIVVRLEPSGQFTAEAVGIPELRSTAATKLNAIERVQEMLTEWLRDGNLVQIELPDANPLLRYAGWAADDAEFDLYLAEIRRFRQEENERDRLPDEEPLPPPEYPKR